MKAILKVALGVIAALGGFLDIGDLVFNTQAGALYRYDLLWAVALGTIGIAVYAEMCGRVAAVTQRPVFDSIRMRLGFGTGLVALVASTAVNLLTVAAELGGLAIILTLLFDAAFSLFVVLAAIGLVVAVALLPFGGIERIFGYGGLLMLVFVAVAFHQSPDWGDVAHGFVPSLSSSTLYLYFVVGVVAAALMPYEVHFSSSGAIEEGWTEKSLKENRLNAIVGYALGGILACALVIVSGYLFHPIGVDPGDLGTVALPAQGAFGETGLLLALGGMMFCVGGAAIDSSFSAAYNLAQFLGWEWGRNRGPKKAPRFTASWLVFLFLAVLIVLSGINPVEITEYAVIFAVVALPLTYLPILLIAGDRSFMGGHANGRLSAALGWIYFAVIVVLAIVAIPLLLMTNAGGG
ncbi:MAG TPA: divalent metal cation transporter [Solirubrobacterales bacterium]|nr:divalent metal cation transporter [Solirubrobacterales bacterium]